MNETTSFNNHEKDEMHERKFSSGLSSFSWLEVATGAFRCDPHTLTKAGS